MCPVLEENGAASPSPGVPRANAVGGGHRLPQPASAVTAWLWAATQPSAAELGFMNKLFLCSWGT